MKVRDLIARLKTLDQDTLVLSARYDHSRGRWTDIEDFHFDRPKELFVEQIGKGQYRDVTDKEREIDQLAVIL